ncbi:LPS export ABC transporter periplasmic protein LptC [Dysgonomonas sp. 521]|nr:LPS export ABC transporter periplasmic protein LptC [Dysgonomonas sp. 521]
MTALMSVVMLFFVSCKEESKNAIDLDYDPEKVPSLNTDSVTMLVSDSGIIRYKMISQTWLIFDRAKDPHWLFPDGFYFEQLDTTFNVIATVKADTAWNYTNKKLWKLRGHVFIHNKVGETFSSNELFWDERQQKVYSKEYVEVVRPDKMTLRGAGGFEANQQMTEYKFLNVGNTAFGKTILYVNEDEENNADSEDKGEEKKE